MTIRPFKQSAAGAAGGFTLIELLLVISLISLMLFFAVPQFQSAILADASRRSTIVLKQTIEKLKRRAVEEQTTYTLHLNLDTHHFWITNENMSEEKQLEAKQQAVDLSDSLFVEAVTFPDDETSLVGEVQIYFYREGYSDRALIQLQRDDGTETALLLESFLPEVRIEDEAASFVR